MRCLLNPVAYDGSEGWAAEGGWALVTCVHVHVLRACRVLARWSMDRDGYHGKRSRVCHKGLRST